MVRINGIQAPCYYNNPMAPATDTIEAPYIEASPVYAPVTSPITGENSTTASVWFSPEAFYQMAQIKQRQNPDIPKDIKTRGANGAWQLNGVEKTPYGDNIYKYTLKNGQTVALMPRENATTIIKTFVHAGSMNETDYNRGISHFDEHNVFNGSSRLKAGAFFNETAKIGAETNASTDYAQTDFYIMTPIADSKTLKQMIDMHSDMLVNPTFPTNMVEKEKGPVTSEISMCNDNTANRAMNTLIKNLYRIETTSEDLIAGSIETVNRITREDVYNHWKKHYTPDNMYTVLTGDFDPNEAIELIAQNFTTPPNPNAEAERITQTLRPVQKSVRSDFISQTDSQASVFCAFCGPTPENAKDDLSLTALGLLLLGDKSSRLSAKLNSMYAMGDFDMQKVGLRKNDPVALIYQFATQGGDDTKVIDEFYGAVKSVIENPPSDDEMKIIKNNLLKSLASGFEDSETITDTIGSALLDGEFDSISDYKNYIEALTPQDLVDVANKYLDFGKMSVSVVHPHFMTERDIKANYLKSPNAIAFSGKKPREISTKNIEEVTLSDNSTLAMNNIDSENCYIDWRLTCKDRIPANPACAYVLTQILNGGSKYHSKEDFSKNASLNSVSFDTEANSFQIRTQASSLYGNMQDAINTMKEAIYAPRFTEEDFEAAKEKIRAYCSSMNKDASTNLLAKLFGRYFPSPKQIIEGLDRLTFGDVTEHYNNLIFNSSSNYVVSAPFEKHPELRAQAVSGLETEGVKFREYAPMLMPSFVPNKKATVLLDTEERNQAQIYKNYSFKISGNIKDEVKFELLNTILGGGTSSELFSELREKRKLAYTTSSQIQSFEDSGILTMRILSTTDDKKQNDIKYDNLKRCLDGFEEITSSLMNKDVSDEKLEAAKLALKQSLAAELEHPASATSLISMNLTQPFGLRRIDEYMKAIDSITKADIRSAARHVFSNKPVYSILASEDTIANQMDYINSLGEVQKQ